jgi:hypothetical protein
MIPKFSSQTDMIGFLRALPQNANYRKMLSDDFGIVAPADAEDFHVSYYFKYLIQGQYKGLKDQDLTTYAVDKTLEFADKFPWVPADGVVSTTGPTSPVSAAGADARMPPKSTSGGKRRPKLEAHDGSAVFLEHRGVWVGFANGGIVVTRKTEAAVRQFLKDKHNI